MNEDDTLQIYQKFTESFNKIWRNGEQPAELAGYVEESFNSDVHFQNQFHDQGSKPEGYIPAPGLASQGSLQTDQRLDWSGASSFSAVNE